MSVLAEMGLGCVGPPLVVGFDVIVAAVAHHGYPPPGADNFTRKLVQGGCFIDVKAGFDATVLRAAGFRVRRP